MSPRRSSDRASRRASLYNDNSNSNSTPYTTPSRQRSSRVRFDHQVSQPTMDTRNTHRAQDSNFPEVASPTASAPPHNDIRRSIPQWNIPDYNDSRVYDSDNQAQRPGPYSALPVSQLPFGNYTTSSRRRSDESDATLYDQVSSQDKNNKFSFSSYEHPYDIRPPVSAYSGHPQGPSSRPAPRRSVSFAPTEASDVESCVTAQCDPSDTVHRRRGVLSNLIDLYALNRRSKREQDDNRSDASMSRAASTNSEFSVGDRMDMRRRDSVMSDSSEMLDPDDPRITGTHKQCLDDPEDVEKNCLKQMDYRQRKKERMRLKVQFNITSMINRHDFLMKLARALLMFGAPSHRIESQLVAAARILEVDAEFIHIPGVIICSFGDIESHTSESHFIKCGGRIDLGRLQKIHHIYRQVVHDELSAKKATKQLEALIAAKPIYGIFSRCLLAFFLSALICPLAFGGSFVDMWVAAAGAFILCALQLTVASKSVMYAQIFEISVAILMSFVARGLSSIRSQTFCYTAISSAGIVGILPGYLILSSSLELASKNIVCGSVKMVYALIYTLSLGFGLQIGSDFYLLLDPSARHSLQFLANNMSTTLSLAGDFAADNGIAYPGLPLSGTFTFIDNSGPLSHDIIEGCYRPASFPWYLQPFPWWTQLFIVPIFSVLSSLANLQPFWTSELVVMTVISCASYASNKAANHFIFGRSDIVSAIGAFTVGLLGNIYSRRMGGTAFTSMVTGVLFLVPSGLSQAGGITAEGSGIDIGGAMISVTIGVTVGLFMSQALVYTFGTRKNAAVFSF